jgi:hypothetical protein
MAVVINSSPKELVSKAFYLSMTKSLSKNLDRSIYDACYLSGGPSREGILRVAQDDMMAVMASAEL